MKLLALAVLVLVPACARHDVTRMSRNYLGGQQPLSGNLALNIEKTGQGDSARYDLFAHWTGRYRIDLKAKESLIVATDGNRMVFSAGEKDVYNDMQCGNGPCIYDDRAYYPVTPAQLRAIAGARRVTVEAVGSRRTIEREFNEDNFERFKDFVARYVPGS